ncbi:hypothetical protein ACHAWO_000301 [Cyclotella atomus]|uniref:VOC domain-containing protein n=1 Tax=Cyclotella atomus TaxID=382360 RepID=A0ABD3P7D2_9STRA
MKRVHVVVFYSLLGSSFASAFVCAPGNFICNSGSQSSLQTQHRTNNAICSRSPMQQYTTACKANRSDDAVTSSSTSSSSSSSDSKTTKSKLSTRTFTHHIAIKTRNIENAINFYSLLGFRLETKFLSASKCAWLIHTSHDEDDDNLSTIVSRIELMQVPPYLLNEPEGMKRRGIDMTKHEELLGLNHFALDVTHNIPKTLEPSQKGTSCEMYQLGEWIQDLNQESIEKFGLALRIASPPFKRLIGRELYEIAFLYDADGALVELLNHQGTLEQEMEIDDWKPTFRGYQTGLNDLSDLLDEEEELDEAALYEKWREMTRDMYGDGEVEEEE